MTPHKTIAGYNLDEVFEQEEARLKAERDAAERQQREDGLRRKLHEIKPKAKPAGGRVPPVGRNPPPPPGVTPAVTSLSDYLRLDNISCVDADGHVFEQYEHLYVRKDIERNADKKQKNFKPYDAAMYFEQQELFLPSFALSCAIVARLYQQKSDPAVNAVLMHYKDKGNGYGWHAQNTLIHYRTKKVIHYPTKDNFAKAATVNSGYPRRALPFSKATLQDSFLVNALQDAKHARYVRQLTGLHDPSVLVEIGQYFQKPTKLWFPWNGQVGADYTKTRAAWLGCDQDNFYLNSDFSLGSTSAARGVRLESSSQKK